MSYLDHLYVVILCGGGGTRVWPLSVKKKPKQFLNFYSDKTLYQETVERAREIVPVERIIIMTNEKYNDEIKKQTPYIPEENIIGEPEKKDTAMAMGVSAAYVHKRDPKGVLINLASDHVISKMDVYYHTLKMTAKVAYEDKVLTSVGIEPTFPHPGLGYIHVGKDIKKEDGLQISEVEGFREKPDIETAKEFLETGEYLWNANNYIWRADTILKAFDEHSPDIAKHIRSIEKAIDTDGEKKVLKKEYSKAPQISIDFAISEKADNMIVTPGKFGWYDIGGWQVVYELGEKDNKGNVLVQNNEAGKKAPVVLEDSSNCLVHSNSQAIGLIGVKDLVVVDTGNGLLICDRKRSNEVKKIVQSLKDNNHQEYV